MRTILVTGGTVFVSRYIAEYFVAKGDDVYVINRNTRPQSDGVKLIQADRHEPGDVLRKYHFDVVIDTAYNSDDINLLLDALESYNEYILISSSSVYPEYCSQPFSEETQTGVNMYWGKYGTDKIKAEKALVQRVPGAYILRPPYLYGQMNNVYREAFVFDCALKDRKFYLPGDGKMKLQFFHVDDLCRFIDIILEKNPHQKIFNVGNKESISVREWGEMCYQIAGKPFEYVNVYDDIEQRNYFSFYNYEYYLDVSRQYELMSDVKPLYMGLRESFDWYTANSEKVIKKPFFDYIDRNLRNLK
ncbi:MAG: NAD-dependent epimerase/dehydratase family protein [Ruminococcus sp.]|nr:NAD-dependent epimerase/dehydratase family protein [Ruminococcus sp.]